MNHAKEAGKMLITLLLIAFTIWMAIKSSAIGVATGVVLLVIWVMLVYSLFSDVTFKIKDFLLKLKANQKVNDGTPKSSEESDSHNRKNLREHRSLQNIIAHQDSLSAVAIEPYKTPEMVSQLIELSNDDGVKADPLYSKCVYSAQESVASNLLASIDYLYKVGLREKYESIIKEWCHIQPVNREQMMRLCDSIAQRYGKADELALQFSKAIHDLERIQAQ